MDVLITGVASGIGRATAERFLQAGHRVWGLDIAPVEARAGLETFVADITDEASLIPIRDRLKGDGIRLDAIVNIAGIHMMASLVEADCAALKRAVDINLCGPMLVDRVFHGCLKERGRIVIVTSEVAGFDPMPFNGLYSVTKTALDAYAQALRQELNLIGQKVVTVRPGAVETPLSAGSVKATRDLAGNTELYRKQAKRFSGIAVRFMGKPIPAEALGALIFRATTVRHPRLIYRKHQNPGLVLLSLLPKRLQCAVIKALLEWF